MNWTDGILSHRFRNIKSAPGDQDWMILDGPVDPLWIENMNTVMDQNRMLFLTNGERISNPPSMKLLFETPGMNNYIIY